MVVNIEYAPEGIAPVRIRTDVERSVGEVHVANLVHPLHVKDAFGGHTVHRGELPRSAAVARFRTIERTLDVAETEIGNQPLRDAVVHEPSQLRFIGHQFLAIEELEAPAFQLETVK